MMHLSQSAPAHVQSTHYTLLATTEILGKLVLVATVGSWADTLGYFWTLTILVASLVLVTVLTIRAPTILHSDGTRATRLKEK